MDGLEPQELITAEQLLRAAKSDAYEHVFFLGPYAQRVSFASQQNRALNLVWALWAAKEIEPDRLVAVIGGGIAGAMTAAALLDIGCKVDLYESNREALARQSGTKHRYIHPTVNRWPEHPISETTQLPYFDWVSDICSSVVKSLREEWLEMERSSGSRLRFEPLASVEGFTEPPGGERRIAVQTANPTKLSNERYHAVIVTSGFANENTRPPTGGEHCMSLPSYWDNEDLDREAADGSIKKFLISGAGDGGLIDAIRIAYEGFNDGAFIIDIARQLDRCDEWHAEGGGRERIIAGEVEAVANLANSLQSGSRDLRKTYLDVAGNLPAAVGALLEGALRFDRPSLVTIYSLEEVPFSPLTAPIHKLLVAYAMRDSVITHQRGQVVDWAPGYIEHGEPTGSLDVRPASTRRDLGKVVVRHGAKPNFARFLKPWPKAAEKLIDKQKEGAANLDLQIWRTASISLKQWLPQAPFPEALELRKPKVEKLVHRILEVMVGHIYVIDDQGFTLAVDPEVQSMPGIQARLANLPSSIFGFPFSWEWRGSSAAMKTPFGGAPGALSGGPVAIGPGKAMVAALQGRLGPFVTNGEGAIFALIASHTAFSAGGSHKGPVYDSNDRIIGYVEHAGRASGVSSDLALIRISDFRSIELDYGPFGAIQSLADPASAFGRSVFMLGLKGEILKGTISATYSPIRFRLSGQTERLDVVDAVRVRPAVAAKGFGEPGDSGAPVVDENGAVVGMLLGADAHFSYIVPIGPYLARSGLRLLDKERSAEELNAPNEVTQDLARTARLLANVNRLEIDYEPLFLPIGEETEDVF